MAIYHGEDPLLSGGVDILDSAVSANSTWSSQKIKEEIENGGGFKKEIVSRLPTTEIDPTTVYFIPNGKTTGTNRYDKFVYLNNVWEKINADDDVYTKDEANSTFAPVSHVNDTTKHITAAERTAWINKSDKATSFTVTLSASGWSSNAQTVTNSNFIVSGYTYIVTPAAASYNTFVQCGIRALDVTTASKMTFNCNTTPTSAVTVNVTRIEVA